MSSRTSRTFAVAAVAAAATAATLVSGDALLTSATADTVYVDSLGRLELENQRLRQDLRAYIAASDVLIAGLDRIDDTADTLKDRVSQRKIENVVKDVRAQLSEFVLDTGSYDDGYQGGGYGDSYYGSYGYTATDGDVQALVDFMASKNFAEDELNAVKTAADRTWFTAAQVATLMAAAGTEDTRIEIAAHLHPQVIDPQNWYAVEDTLKFSTSKRTLRTRLAQ